MDVCAGVLLLGRVCWLEDEDGFDGEEDTGGVEELEMFMEWSAFVDFQETIDRGRSVGSRASNGGGKDSEVDMTYRMGMEEADWWVDED